MYQTISIALLTLLVQSGQELYQQALVQERAAGNLQAAISLYEDTARNAAGDRDLAARALMGAARCYERLGQLKAREIYEDIARSYPDQQQHVSAALARLSALLPSQPPSIPNVPVMEPRTVVKLLPPEGVVQVGNGIFWQQSNPQFDPAKPIRVMGTVVKVEFVNPSISIHIDVKAADGTTAVYRVFGANPRRLVEQGFTPRSVSPGDVITVEGLLGNLQGTIGYATVTFSDGRKLSLGMSVSGALESPR